MLEFWPETEEEDKIEHKIGITEVTQKLTKSEAKIESITFGFVFP